MRFKHQVTIYFLSFYAQIAETFVFVLMLIVITFEVLKI